MNELVQKFLNYKDYEMLIPDWWINSADDSSQPFTRSELIVIKEYLKEQDNCGYREEPISGYVVLHFNTSAI